MRKKKESFSIKELIYDNNKAVEVIEKPKTEPKANYSDLLKSPKWQKKRLEILSRDNFQCKLCNDEDTLLNIHHKRYINGKLPWQYDDCDLITICKDCHGIVEYFKKANYDIIESSILKLTTKGNNILFFISQKDGFNFASATGDKINCTYNMNGSAFAALKIFLSKINSNG